MECSICGCNWAPTTMMGKPVRPDARCPAERQSKAFLGSVGDTPFVELWMERLELHEEERSA